MSKNKHEGAETGRFKTDKPNVSSEPAAQEQPLIGVDTGAGADQTSPAMIIEKAVIHRGNIHVREMSKYKMLFDVQAFHEKMGIEVPADPTVPEKDVLIFRYGFMREELSEFWAAQKAFELAMEANPPETMANEHKLTALKNMGDALIDLIYVALGTADLMGLPFDEMWNEVQRANMSKERAKSAEHSALSTGRGHVLDVVKPEGWNGPDHDSILRPLVTDG